MIASFLFGMRQRNSKMSGPGSLETYWPERQISEGLRMVSEGNEVPQVLKILFPSGLDVVYRETIGH